VADRARQVLRAAGALLDEAFGNETG